MKNNKRIYIFIFVFLFLAVMCYGQADTRNELMKEYDKLMKSDPNRLDAHRNFIAKWKGRTDDLVSLYGKLVNNSPNNALYQYSLGYVYASSGRDENIDKAIESFKKAVELDQNFTMAHFSLGSMLLKKGDYKSAEIELQKAIELDDKFYSAYFNLGEVYRNQKQNDLAMLAYKKAIEINPKWGYPYFGIGMIYFDQDKLQDAELQFNQAIKYSPEIGMAHFKLGQIYAKQDMDIELVSKSYRDGQKATQITQKEIAMAFYELGKIFSNKGNSGLAVQAYKNSINIDPNLAIAQFELGNEYYKMGLKERSIEHYKLAIQADPTIRNSFVDDARKEYESGNFESALASLDKTLAIDPENAPAHFYYADIQQKQGNLTEAIKHYEDTIRIDPNFVKAYMPLGDLYYSQGKVKEAISLYRKAMALDQSLENLFFKEGSALLSSVEKQMTNGEDAEKIRANLNLARTNLEKHILINPDDSEANYKLAYSYDLTSDKSNAMKYYQKTIELDPSRMDVQILIAGIYNEQGKFNEAISALSYITNSATVDSKLKIKAYKVLSKVYEKQGNEAMTVLTLEELAKLDPADADSRYKLGIYYEDKQADIDKAMIEYEAVISLDQTKADPFLRLGAIYIKKGADDKKIIDVYEKGLVLEPNHPQIQYDLAQLYKKYGNIEKAIEHYDLANEYAPYNHQWHYEYAKLLEGRDNAKAVDEYTKAIELKRNFAQAYFDRAMLLKKVKAVGGRVYRNEQIIEDLKQVVELEPNRAEAYFNIALLYKEMEADDTARTYFERTVKANPSYPGAYAELGRISEKKGELSRAIDEYKKEIAINDSSAIAHQRLGYLYSHHLNDLVKADAEFQKALKLDPDRIETLVHYGNI
ncbi:MAG: tetratricopeptide repeat protein, partial [Candidatus Poribacteria bacterium]